MSKGNLLKGRRYGVSYVSLFTGIRTKSGVKPSKGF
jgi:hypothetical protein